MKCTWQLRVSTRLTNAYVVLESTQNSTCTHQTVLSLSNLSKRVKMAAVEIPQKAPASVRDLIGARNLDGSVEFLNMMLYGEPSAGKTYFYGTAEEWPDEFLPALLVDIDGGF